MNLNSVAGWAYPQHVTADYLNRIEQRMADHSDRDKIIEALFRLKPTLRDEYGKDFDRFAKEIIAAGAVAFGEESLAFIKALL